MELRYVILMLAAATVSASSIPTLLHGVSRDARAGGLLAPDIRAATIVVAARDSRHPFAADYLCSNYGSDEECIVDAIEAALSVTEGAGGNGGKVVFLDGTFSIEQTITLHGKVGTNGPLELYDVSDLILEGQASPSRNPYSPQYRGTIFSLDANVTMFSFEGGSHESGGGSFLPGAGERVEAVTIRNINFLGNGRSHKVLEFKGCNDFQLVDCQFDQCRPAVDNRDGWDFHMQRCKFSDCGSDVRDASGHYTEAAVVAHSTSQVLIGVAYFVLSDCTWEPLGGPGIYCYAEASSKGPVASLRVVNCKFEGSATQTAYPAILGEFTVSHITGNRFFKADEVPGRPETGRQVYMVGRSHLNLVSNNMFLSHAKHGISVTGDSNLITSNIFNLTYGESNVGRGHIELRSASGAVVLGNLGRDWAMSASAHTNLIDPSSSIGNATVLDLQGDAAINTTASPTAATNEWLEVKMQADNARRYVRLYK